MSRPSSEISHPVYVATGIVSLGGVLFGTTLSRSPATLRQSSGRWVELLDPSLRLALVVGIGLGICQRVTGISTAFFYAPTIADSAGFKSPVVDTLSAVGVAIMMFASTIVVMRLVDRVGRRPLLLVGLSGMVLCMAVLGFFFLPIARSPDTGWMVVLALTLFVGAWIIGPGTVAYLIISELYPLKVKGLAMSIVTVVLWGAYLLATLTFLTLIQLLGQAGTFWTYGALCIVALVFVYFLVPETKGRSLEEIEASWRAGKRPGKLETH